ncbi:MAG TPA: GDP-mannose 4,6-dehydratase, partial [Acidimicrobiales bacterium]|nr:GDP-mannose 4,6-dehydratase [Acidimicrobiales bacterium]
MRAFVTGAYGFVGGWLGRHLEACGDDLVTLAATTDIADAAAVEHELVEAAPQVVYHLAGLSHVGHSWDVPEETLQVNAVGTLHVLEAARACSPPPRVLLVSSAEVYGSGDGSPLDEQAPLRPASPYAASKVAAEFLGLQAHLGRGLPVIRVRPFNHVGPGQAPFFVVAALAQRIAAAEAAGATGVPVGDLTPARDFTDVRDVVRAYRLVARLGVPGEVYNVCSGSAVTIAEVAKLLLASSPGEIH